MNRKSYFAAIAVLAAHCLVLSSFMFAQGAPDPAGRGGRGGRGAAVPPVSTHEVSPDRTVTFHLRAPDATSVKLSGDLVKGSPDMTKGGGGQWSITTGPLNPAVYNYTFVVDGVRNIYSSSPMVKLGGRSSESMFGVAGGSGTGLPAGRRAERAPAGGGYS
jgi:enterochelin esterase family protein